jgi:hypothetical protein
LDLQVQHMMTAPSNILSSFQMLTMPVYHHVAVLHYATVYTTVWTAPLGTSRHGSFITHPSCKYKALLKQTLLRSFFQYTLLILYHARVCVCVRGVCVVCVCMRVCTCTCMHLFCPLKKIFMMFGKKELLLVVN